MTPIFHSVIINIKSKRFIKYGMNGSVVIFIIPNHGAQKHNIYVTYSVSFSIRNAEETHKQDRLWVSFDNQPLVISCPIMLIDSLGGNFA
ncbi:hypothetical protein DFP95_103118 [Cohnella lupini]|uniref:Uncharacterized protein n=1 Tax=Cohnella lupini TaxID=1294267 RepID=A0A3D9IQA9_9BACL|nr:hypothetical protein DFP95_103118 [Cohnella lupini]